MRHPVRKCLDIKFVTERSPYMRAREYYKARGFVDIGVADVAPHPRLPHRGGSVLMSRSSSCDA